MASAVASLSSPSAMGIQWSNGVFVCVCVCVFMCVCVYVHVLGVCTCAIRVVFFAACPPGKAGLLCQYNTSCGLNDSCNGRGICSASFGYCDCIFGWAGLQ